MKINAVKKIIREEFKYLKHAMNLDTWRIKFYYIKFESHARAEIEHLDEYEDATIEIEPGKIDNRADLFQCLRHELLHLLTPDVGRIKKRLDEILSAEAFDFVQQMLYGTEELAVRKLENMLNGIGMTPVKMVQQGRKMA